jgi:Cell shape-determining protein
MSSVQTIFDPGISLPVKIGAKETNALLVGGRVPRLTLIEKEEIILPGDEVYASASDFPYGLYVGEILELFPESGSAFQEASLKIPYDGGSLDRVFVFTL